MEGWIPNRSTVSFLNIFIARLFELKWDISFSVEFLFTPLFTWKKNKSINKPVSLILTSLVLWSERYGKVWVLLQSLPPIHSVTWKRRFLSLDIGLFTMEKKKKKLYSILKRGDIPPFCSLKFLWSNWGWTEIFCVSGKISNQWSYEDKQERGLLRLQSGSRACDSGLIRHPSLRPCPSSQSPLPFDSGLSPVTCFGQWDVHSQDVIRGLKCAWLAVLAQAGLRLCFPAMLLTSYPGRKGDVWCQAVSAGWLQ